MNLSCNTKIFSVIFTRTLPFRFVANIANVLATAFGTASSSATLPLTIEALETKNKIDPRVTRFVSTHSKGVLQAKALLV
jgi:Na+/H+-dicarboxylate symporter